MKPSGAGIQMTFLSLFSRPWATLPGIAHMHIACFAQNNCHARVVSKVSLAKSFAYMPAVNNGRRMQHARHMMGLGFSTTALENP